MTNNYLDAVKQAGVVGAGGAGFPTHVKLAAEVDLYVANGAECEPLLQVDQHLMSQYAAEVVRGLEIGMQLTKAEKGIIALKSKYDVAIAALKEEIQHRDDIELFLLDNYYPAGDEHVLVYEVSGRLVPEGGIPIQSKVVVNNVVTLINVARAVSGIPVTSVWMTVTGEVRNPQTFEVPVGTPIREVLDTVGGPTVDPYAVIVGGPMMGTVTNDLEEPITKINAGLIVLPPDHRLVQFKTASINFLSYKTRGLCIRCNLCTEVCPRYLLGHELKPAQIMRAVGWGLMSNAQVLTNAFLCTGCGACTYYGCPMDLHPSEVIQAIKQQLIAEEIDNPHASAAIAPHEFQQIRKIPNSRLIGRLGLIPYNQPVPIANDQSVVPKTVRIPLKQHIGVPSLPLVEVGDIVDKGAPIGEIPEDSLGARIHASISGKIVEISDIIAIEARNT
ncbi:MAG: 4Fe-4S dicluster domain-containing protein [Candidatus Hodarchaeales archaeon]|jgi:RnfABCDGE-type electron transport complex C subunit